jgi:hypothetical protein
MLWRDMRGRTKEEIHKELQDLDPMGSPHKEEKVIGGNIDLDLLSLFPQRYARIMIGIRDGQAFQGQQWREREGKMSSPRKKKGRGIYTPSHKNGRYSVPGRIIRPKTGKIRPKIWPPIWVTHKKSLAKMAIT